jgi:hypothetical protein
MTSVENYLTQAVTQLSREDVAYAIMFFHGARYHGSTVSVLKQPMKVAWNCVAMGLLTATFGAFIFRRIPAAFRFLLPFSVCVSAVHGLLTWVTQKPAFKAIEADS